MLNKESFKKLRDQLKIHLKQIKKEIMALENTLTDEEYDNPLLKDYHTWTELIIDALSNSEQEILNILYNKSELFEAVEKYGDEDRF